MSQGTAGTNSRLTIGIRPTETFLGAEEHNPELRICHIPLTTDVFLLTPLEIKAPKDLLIALRQFGKTLIDRLTHFEDFRLGSYPCVPDRDIRIGQWLAANAAAVLQNHVPADAVYECAELFRVISDLALPARAHETRECFLNNIVHIGALMSHVVEHLIAKFQPEPLERGLGELHRHWGWNRPACHKCAPHSNSVH